MLREVIEVDDEEQQLGADERRDDDLDAEIEDAVGDRARALRARTIASCRPSRYAAASSTP